MTIYYNLKRSTNLRGRMKEIFFARCILLLFLIEMSHSLTCNEENKWSWGRYYLYSTEGKTIGDIIKEDLTWSNAASRIVEFLNSMSEKRLKESRYLRCLKHDMLAMEEEFPIATGKMRLWGFQQLEKCVVDIDLDAGDNVQGVAQKVFKYLSIFDEKLVSNIIPRILKEYEGIGVQTNWTSLESISRFQVDGPNDLRKCEVFKLVALKDDGKWNLDASFTNYDKDIELPSFQRWYGGELISFHGSEVTGSKERSLHGCDIEGNPVSVEKGTFNAEVWEGRPGSHAFITEQTSDNRAIKRSLEKTDLIRESVGESRWVSNIFILFLPSILALFPVSLFQEVSLMTGFVYSIGTDIISVMPVVVKGIEFVYFGSTKKYSIYSRYYGGSQPDDSSVVIHWVSYCTMKKKVIVQGWAYIIVGLTLMCGGLALEIIASRQLAILKQKWIDEHSENPNAELSPYAGILWHWNFMSDSSTRGITAEVPEYFPDS